jgi:hypothetical protein
MHWNNIPLSSTFVSATQLTVTIPASLLVDEGTAAVTVFNPAPGGGVSNAVNFTIDDASLSAVTGTTIMATEGLSFTTTVATFTDGNSAAPVTDFTATIMWGDGQTSPGTIRTNGNGNFAVNATHTYTTPGRFAVSVAITDEGGTQATASSTAHVPGSTPPPSCLTMVAGEFTNTAEYFTLFVTNSYMTLLHRAPDGSGLNAAVNAMVNGTRDEQIEAGLVSSGEYIQNHGGLGASWVQALYQDLLHRTPSNSEVQAWVGALQNGMSPASIAAEFTNSGEHEAIRVQGDYMRYLGRVASQSEVNGWVAALVSHSLTNEGVIAEFVGSLEYWQNHFSNDMDWLFGAYNDILNRAPDPAGFNGWLGLLQNC